jgi:hypothetical protein
MMAYHSNGAFDFDQLYHMPVYLRTFHLKQLEDIKQRESEEMKKVTAKSKTPKR